MDGNTMRVLVLDDNLIGRGVRDLRELGVELEVTALTREDLHGESVWYRISPRGLELARQASDYDAVIIGNNMRTGMVYAREIPEEMRRHTLIVWNEVDPEEQEAYADLGYVHFGARHQGESDWLVHQADLKARSEA